MQNVKSTFFIVTMSIALTAYVSAHAQETPRFSANSLQSSIKIALEKNPKIKSNGKVLEAMLLRVESQKRSQLPSLSLGYSASQSMGSTYSSKTDMDQSFESRTRGATASLSWNIFDGFASHYKIKSMQCDYEQRKVSFNSSNTQSNNTRGQIAGLVASSYLNLSQTRQVIYFNDELLKILKIFRTIAKTPRQIADVEDAMNEITLSLQELKDSEVSATSDYNYVVTIPAPVELDSFQDIINSIKIPENAALAIDIANLKSPDILTARYQIDCMRLRLRTAKAVANAPRVDLSVSANFGGQNTDLIGGSFTQSHSMTAGIAIRKTFGAGTSSSLSADALDIEAANDNLDGALSDIRHSLVDTIYPKLMSSSNLAESYKQNFVVSKNNIELILADISTNKPVKVDDALKELGNLRQNWNAYLQFTRAIINLKFQVQKTIGTLFESLGVKEFE